MCIIIVNTLLKQHFYQLYLDLLGEHYSVRPHYTLKELSRIKRSNNNNNNNNSNNNNNNNNKTMQFVSLLNIQWLALRLLSWALHNSLFASMYFLWRVSILLEVLWNVSPFHPATSLEIGINKTVQFVFPLNIQWLALRQLWWVLHNSLFTSMFFFFEGYMLLEVIYGK